MAKDSYVEIKNANFSDSNPPLVSVAMIAYNLENFIEAAIESVLNQQTNFKVELVIGEDCSTDKTKDIILRYQLKYPNKIKVLAHDRNLGLTPNSIATQNACKGKYIALLDGDDYWTNSKKLQTQIDFLEDNPNFAGTGHQALKIYEDGSPSSLFGDTVDRVYTLNETLSHRKFHTSSLVYRKNIWDKAGGIPSNISSNERAMYPMIALHGPIKYFAMNACVYRLSGANLTSRITFRELETDLNMLPWLKKLNTGFPILRFRSFLHLCMFTYGRKISFWPLLKHYINFTFFSFSYFPKNLPDIKWGTIFFLRRLKANK